ncbi:GNAT family N-acetyltransferase [Arthrobacter sp. H14]|uniref:GNAT family N-acetyltransferase n=1 Tax=Arthrobacter sp. H14 TaxID=1312959 RepID=UPI0006884385|nr:N-acetyltransferase [Arthrobacter sp. H14]
MTGEALPGVQHNFAQSRFDIYDHGTRAGFLQYEMTDGRMCFILTELAPAYRNRDFAASFLGGILDDMHHRRLAVLPYCPMVRAFMATRPEYFALVPADQRQRFGFIDGAASLS